MAGLRVDEALVRDLATLRFLDQSVLGRLTASVRERATARVHARLAGAAGPELTARLEKLLLVPEGQRRSELDLLRRPPFTPTITGLVKALDRLERVRLSGLLV